MPHKSSAIGLCAPPRSRMAFYVACFEASAGPPLWRHRDPGIAEAAAVLTLASQPRASLPPDVIRKGVAVPLLREAGVSSEQPLYELLADALTRELQQAPAVRASKGGHPPPRPFHAAVVTGAYVEALTEAPGRSDNSQFELVARRLGPGLTRDHVRRIVRPWRERLGAADALTRDAMLLAAVRAAEQLRLFDLRPRDAFARKPL